jgi:hypothetical protein
MDTFVAVNTESVIADKVGRGKLFPSRTSETFKKYREHVATNFDSTCNLKSDTNTFMGDKLVISVFDPYPLYAISTHPLES